MPSSLLGNTRGRTTSRVTCHLRPWTAHTVGRPPVCPSSPLDSVLVWTTSSVAFHNGPWIKHDQTTSGVEGHHHPWVAYPWSSEACHHSPLDSIQGRTMSAMVCYHLPLIAHIIGLWQAWQCYNRLWEAHTVE